MKSTILLELQYLAPIQYYTKLLQYDSVCIEQYENYSKGSFRNRCCIVTSNGILPLSIPLLKGKNQQTNIREVLIDNTTNWQLIHWRSLATAYGKSPFFEYYQDDLLQVYEKKTNLLFDFCFELQNLVLDLLQIDVNLKLTTSYDKHPDASIEDFRNKILPKNFQQQQDNLFSPQKYPQVFSDRLGFLPNMSILDLLFCTGPEASAILFNSISK